MNRFVLALAALVAMPAIALSPRAVAAATQDTMKKGEKPLHVSRGAPVTLTDYLIPGKITVFDFYSDFCGPCVRVAPALENLHRTRDEIVVVKVDINRPSVKGTIDWKSPVAQQYRLNSIPHFKIYGPEGKLLAEDRPNQPRAREMVIRWLE